MSFGKTWWAFGLVVALGACANDAECHDGQELVGGACLDNTASADSGAAGSAGAGDASGGAAGANADGAAGSAAACNSDFGTTCTADAECGCDAPYCALQPGQTSGYCTATGCVESPDICPEGWSCLDLSVFQAGLPSICREP